MLVGGYCNAGPYKYIKLSSVVGEKPKVNPCRWTLPVVVENLTVGGLRVPVGYDKNQECGVNRDGADYRYGSLSNTSMSENFKIEKRRRSVPSDGHVSAWALPIRCITV